MKRYKVTFVLGFVITIMFLNFTGYPFWDTLKSYGIMYIYNKQVVKNSYLSTKNIEFKIPGGIATLQKDWYPFMLHHDASQEFSRFIGKDLSCIILYSFGAFDFWKGSSNFYNPASSYQGAFYGGYAIFNKDDEAPPYGFDVTGDVNLKEIEAMPLFDQTKLVLPSVGCPRESIIFNTSISKIERNISYADLEGWTMIGANINTNAPTHVYKGSGNIGYLQYGKPHDKFVQDEDYPIISLKGRIYTKYIEEFGGTFILYVIARDLTTLEECDQKLLSETKINSY